jgi:GT2 family glycosyltransferase
MELTIIIPFYNGNRRIADELLKTLKEHNLPTILVDDLSTRPLSEFHGAQVLNLNKKRYFSGAVNEGINACDTDVLVLNQDAALKGSQWLSMLAENRDKYAMIGERIFGNHPAWENDYIKGSFMFMRRDAVNKTGLLDEKHFPHWGSTADWQARAARKGFQILPLKTIPGWVHLKGRGPFGEATVSVLNNRPDLKPKLVRTPPLISVIVPSFNHGMYLHDAVNSLIGGSTCLGDMPGQTFQGFEIIIIDDASTDPESRKIAASLADGWKGIKFIQRKTNGGTGAANNTGINQAFGKYVTVMCGDDMMESERLEVMLTKIEENPDRVVYDDLQMFTGNEYTSPLIMKEYNFDRLLKKNHMHCGILFKKHAWQVIGGYPEAMKYGREDWAVNVALGINGYCGVRIPKAMYLYRRENQNRTLSNTTPSWHEFFLGQLEKLYPRVYAGERPMGCCGSNGQPKAVVSTKGIPAVQGVDGMTLIQYIGGSIGTQSWYGVVSGKQYKFGLKKNLGNVDPEDLQTGKMQRPGLLEIRENGKPVFKLAPVAKPVQSVAEKSAFSEKVVEVKEEVILPEVIEEEPVKARELNVSAAAQKLADEYDISSYSIQLVKPTGAGGKITVRDVRKYLEGR